MKTSIFFILSFFLFLRTLAQTTVNVTVDKNTVLQENFLGLGYNIPIDEGVTTEEWNTKLGKAIKEVSSNTYTRVFSNVKSYAPSKGVFTWNSNEQVIWNRMMGLLKEQNSDVFVVNGYWGTQPAFLNGNKEITNAAMLNDWVDVQLKSLDQWINVKGFTNIKQWIVTNEFNSFDTFDSTRRANWFHHAQLVKDGLAKINLTGKLQVVGTDALGRVDAWRATIPDAINYHPDLLDVYEVHDYPADNYWLQDKNGGWFAESDGASQANYLDESQYKKKLNKFVYAKYLIRNTSKDMILGEFGGIAQETNLGNGKVDVFLNGDTGEFGSFLADYAIAGLNTGLKAMAYWWLHDNGVASTTTWSIRFDHGLMYDERGEWRKKPAYFAYGLLSRYVRKNSKVYKTTSTNSKVHVATVMNNEDGKYTVVVNNRESADIKLVLKLPGASGKFRKYDYDPANTPIREDLPLHTAELEFSNGISSELIKANHLVVYTNEFDETAPEKVKNVVTTGKSISWTGSTDSDFIYYRIYKSYNPINKITDAIQIGSSIVPSFIDRTYTIPNKQVFYAVTAVDKYGNESISSTELANAIEKKSNADFSIYPNPAENTVNITFKKPLSEAGSLNLYDYTGRRVLSKELDISTSLLSFDTSNLTNGVYLLYMRTGDGSLDIGKLIIKK